jgi:hypothetical protein
MAWLSVIESQQLSTHTGTKTRGPTLLTSKGKRCSTVKTKSYVKILLNQLLMLILDIGIRTIIVLVVVGIILANIMLAIIKAVGVIVSSLSKS